MSAKRIGGDWVENIDPSSGKTYYANLTTQETSWTWPEDVPREEGGEAEGGNDEDWDEKLDPGSGKMYYYNKTTQETTWTKPVGYKGNTKEDSENNPANWEEMDDEASGNKYYFNSVTQETSWTKPACLEAPAEDAAAEEVAAPAAAEKLAALKAMKLTDEEEEELAAGGDGGAAEEGGIADYADYTAKSAGNAAAGVPTASSVGYEARALLDQVTDKVTTAEIQATIAGLSFTEYAEKNFNYDRKGIFGTKTTTDKITSWKGDRALIKTSLCSLNDKDLQGEAVQCFRNVTGFMGDRNTNKNNMDHCYKLLNNMLQSMEDLRNEVYCQICKQTKKNPKEESTLAGWQLMIICLACFPPGALLKDYLMAYCNENIDPENPQVSQYAKFALHRVNQIVKLGARRELPTHVEVEACKRLQPVTVRVNFLDNKYVMMPVNSWTTAELFAEMLCIRLGIENSKPFAVFEVSSADEERVLEPEERILDLVAYWGRLIQEDRSKKGKNAEVEEFHFVFKVRLFFEISDEDLAAVEMMYIQATHDVVDARYPCSEQDSITLAALQVQEAFGDHPGGDCDYITGKLTTFLAEKYLEDREDSELEEQVLKLYEKLSGYTQQEARLSYLDYVKSWKIYGSSYYFAEPQNNRDFPPEVVLAINAKGVLVVDPETKEFLKEFPYSQVVTWGHSANSFVVVTGNMVRQTKVYFKTDQGKEMNNIVRCYVEHLMGGSTEGGGAAEA